MQKLTELPMLRIGLVGSGFIAAFHLQSMLGVRNVSVGGVYSRSAERRTRIADKARSLASGRRGCSTASKRWQCPARSMRFGC